MHRARRSHISSHSITFLTRGPYLHTYPLLADSQTPQAIVRCAAPTPLAPNLFSWPPAFPTTQARYSKKEREKKNNKNRTPQKPPQPRTHGPKAPKHRCPVVGPTCHGLPRHRSPPALPARDFATLIISSPLFVPIHRRRGEERRAKEQRRSTSPIQTRKIRVAAKPSTRAKRTSASPPPPPRLAMAAAVSTAPRAPPRRRRVVLLLLVVVLLRVDVAEVGSEPEP